MALCLLSPHSLPYSHQKKKTSRGYVSLDPENGQILWNYTTKSAPYLPVMDIFGDVIGMDKDRLYYVGADGKAEHPINIEILGPAFSWVSPWLFIISISLVIYHYYRLDCLLLLSPWLFIITIALIVYY